MANITKRNDTYLITVSCGYGMNGKRIRRYMTYKPKKSMTKRQIEKELQQQAALFEEKCMNGQALDNNIRFSDFAEIWFNDRKSDLRPKTYSRYQSMLPRINAAIGHMKISKIQPPHLRAFYKNLAEGGIRLDTKYKCHFDVNDYLTKNNLTRAAFAKEIGIPSTTLSGLVKGYNVSLGTAEKVSKYLNKPLSEVFDTIGNSKPLADKTILHHHRLISSIFSTAVEWGILFSSPCDRTKPPKVGKKEPKYLDEKQTAVLLDLLEQENIEYKTMIRVLLFTGLRRGELLGLEWSDIDFNKGTMQIVRSSLYLPERGIFEDETKNDTSNRVIKLSKTVLKDLQIYRKHQIEQRFSMGDRWNETNKIFTSYDGNPLHPDTLSKWFKRFIERNNDKLPYITLHSLRRTNATLQINGGVPVTTIAKRLGHADTSTTMRIYAHAIKSADEAAAETLENLLMPQSSVSVC
ncbi:MAG: tyrosine-type recombinase/integrase [Ruminococcus sp.]